MKNKFNKPWLEILELDTADIITNSNDNTGDNDDSSRDTMSGFRPWQ